MVICKFVSTFLVKLTLAVSDAMNQIRTKTISDNGQDLMRDANLKSHQVRPEKKFAYTKGIAKLLNYRRQWRSFKLAVFLLVTGVLFLFWPQKLWLQTEPEDPNTQYISNFYNRKGDPIKRILLWSGTQRKEVRSFGIGQKIFIEKGCAFTQCEIFGYRWGYPIDYFDAVVIVFNDEFITQDDLMMPEFSNGRNLNQRLVFFTQESPTALRSHYNITLFNNYFNWTMTYLRNSDIPLPYGRIIPKASAPRTPEEVAKFRHKARQSLRKRTANTAVRRKKKRKVAWMVSHCWTHSMRELYVMELKKYIDVDVYGKCGNLTCPIHPLHSSDPRCYTMLQSNYKFYLAFENSLCKDYVTEKFFKIMAHDIIPVVYGGADYSKYAPPYSYINAGKFEPRELADYLNLLDANDTLYNEYFWWKDHYRVEYSVDDMSRHGFCDLCQKLHEDSSYKSYREMSTDWGEESKRCA